MIFGFFQFQGILKPSYNSVDMLEVELMDDTRGPRDFNPELVQVLPYFVLFLN